MRNPERVLNSLSEHSKVSSYKFERLYRVLFNSEMFLLAYHNIQGRQGNMTEGSDGKTIDGMSLKRIENLIDALKDESYQPKPARRTYIPKKKREHATSRHTVYRRQISAGGIANAVGSNL